MRWFAPSEKDTTNGDGHIADGIERKDGPKFFRRTERPRIVAEVERRLSVVEELEAVVRSHKRICSAC